MGSQPAQCWESPLVLAGDNHPVGSPSRTAHAQQAKTLSWLVLHVLIWRPGVQRAATMISHGLKYLDSKQVLQAVEDESRMSYMNLKTQQMYIPRYPARGCSSCPHVEPIGGSHHWLQPQAMQAWVMVKPALRSGFYLDSLRPLRLQSSGSPVRGSMNLVPQISEAHRFGGITDARYFSQRPWSSVENTPI